MAIALPAQTFTTLHSFDFTDGGHPVGGVAQGTDGSLFGTTLDGGNYGTENCFGGCGTIFKITTNGTLTTLYIFCSESKCADGQYTYSGLTLATNGNFYGVTTIGGAGYDGTVFRITSSGALTTLHSFDGTDGESPYVEGWLVQATNGDFYGATYEGGTTSTYCPSGCGTVFKITPSGALTTLHNFDGTDGESPFTGLTQATNGDLYGTTSYGGNTICTSGCGTVFKMTLDGADGEYPFSALIQATDGNLYGTTEEGGAYGGGTVFKITPSGKLTTLYSFCPESGCPDGEFPAAELVQATDGNFYGTTYNGGTGTNCTSGCGTIFEITASGTLTTLHSFDGTDGAGPEAGLVQETNGFFYGTTYDGGANSSCAVLGGGSGACGTVFSLSVGLGPFVKTLPTSGNVGAAVKILGTDLTGATAVSFNGTAATFTVKSRYLITATVPVGAATGTVQVVTPKGTLLSNLPFRVP
jgi:uncharacterized repeat protein (TIGR03803 family)